MSADGLYPASTHTFEPLFRASVCQALSQELGMHRWAALSWGSLSSGEGVLGRRPPGWGAVPDAPRPQGATASGSCHGGWVLGETFHTGIYLIANSALKTKQNRIVTFEYGEHPSIPHLQLLFWSLHICSICFVMFYHRVYIACYQGPTEHGQFMRPSFSTYLFKLSHVFARSCPRPRCL